MPSLDRTRALMAELAAVIGAADLPQDPNGGYRLSVGDATDVLVYGGDDETILVVVPLGALPLATDYAVANYLLHLNMFNADTAPFVTATDDSGTLLLWGKLAIGDFDGTRLARLFDNLAEQAVKIRGEAGAE